MARTRMIDVSPQSGQAVRVARDELIRVVDVEDHQVGDMWAIDAADPSRWVQSASSASTLKLMRCPGAGRRITMQG